MPGSFSLAEFPPSNRWEGKSDAYAQWAVAAADRVARGVSSGIPLMKLLSDVAESRKGLADQIQAEAAPKFGSWRDKPSVTHLDAALSHFIRRATRGLSEMTRKPIDLIWPSPLPASVPRLRRQTFYHTLAGDRIPATAIGQYLVPVLIPPYRFNSGTLVLEHTSPQHIAPIMTDVSRRLELVRATPPGPLTQEIAAQLFQAMYGFYQAMPYPRGTAAVGRSFFAGLALSLFGVRLSALTIDPDLLALTAWDQESFVAEVLSQLPATCARRCPEGKTQMD